jgi:predicted secreted protein
MSGEINATNVVISKSGAVVGQGAATLTINGNPIDISNKSNGDYITLLDGELAARQLQFSVELVYNNDASYRALRADDIAGTQGQYTIDYPGSGTTDESFSGTFMPTQMSDNLAQGEAVKTNVTFVSSGPFTHVPAAD